MKPTHVGSKRRSSKAARREAGRRPNLRAAIDSFTVARAALPQSAAILLALAHAQRGYGDLEPALASYDAIVAMVPRNREALLGRAITLSYLERHSEVIETTTRMIDMGTWLMGDAYYWRARSRFVLKALDEAWSDAEHAVTLAPNTNVYTLAGVIAYDRKELAVAKDRFQRARDADASNCTAHSYFALVSAAQNNWPEATPVFSLAMTCFVGAAAAATQELAQIEASDYDAVFKPASFVNSRTRLRRATSKPHRRRITRRKACCAKASARKPVNIYSSHSVTPSSRSRPRCCKS